MQIGKHGNRKQEIYNKKRIKRNKKSDRKTLKLIEKHK